MPAILERVIMGILIIGLCVTIGYLKSVQNKLEADLKKCSENQDKILTFCKENEQTKDKVREALGKNKAGIEGFNSVLDALFGSKK